MDPARIKEGCGQCVLSSFWQGRGWRTKSSQGQSPGLVTGESPGAAQTFTKHLPRPPIHFYFLKVQTYRQNPYPQRVWLRESQHGAFRQVPVWAVTHQLFKICCSPYTKIANGSELASHSCQWRIEGKARDFGCLR